MHAQQRLVVPYFKSLAETQPQRRTAPAPRLTPVYLVAKCRTCGGKGCRCCGFSGQREVGPAYFEEVAPC